MTAQKTPKNKGGRPRMDDYTAQRIMEITESMLSLDAKWDQINLALLSLENPIKVSYSTVCKLIKKKYKMSFKDFRDKRKDGLRLTLKQKAIQMATMGNATMLIFCLKNICDWSDKGAEENEKPIEINLNYKLKGKGNNDGNQGN